MTLLGEVINEFDTIEFCIKKDQCKFDKNIPFWGKTLGMHYKIYGDKIYFGLSCKLFSTATNLGAINRNNYEEIVRQIAKIFGIIIHPNYLYTEVSLRRVDVKKDRFMDENPCFYISDLHRLFKRNTFKYEIHRYEDLTYDNGLSLVPKTKSKHRYSVYHKGHEVLRSQNKEYREKFDFTFLENLNYCLRSEVQLKGSDNIKKAFNIGRYEHLTFENVFNKNLDIVSEQFGKLFKYYGWEV